MIKKTIICSAIHYNDGILHKELLKPRPKEIFRTFRDVEDPYLTKGWWQKSIRIKLDILNRKQEIEKGILI